MSANDQECDPVIEAANWYVAHRTGELTPAERAAFLAWLKSSPAHIEEYFGVAAAEQFFLAAEARNASDDVSELDVSNPRLAHDNIIPFGRDEVVPAAEFRPRQDQKLPHRKLPQRLLAIACTVLLTLAVSVYAFREPLGFGFGDTYQTTHGQLGSWRLSDGSLLHLNTQSAATVRFRAGERLVKVHYGQARFGVVHDKARPFRVMVGNATIIAAGTEFEVYRTDETVQITTISGRVAVLKDEVPSSVTPVLDIPGAVAVEAGQQVVVDRTSISKPRAVNLENVGAWMQRRIVFERSSLRQVTAEFNRYSTVPLKVADESLSALQISGAFSAFDPNSFLDFMRHVEGVTVDVRADVILLRQRLPPEGRVSPTDSR
jgi:transmembrane sensor